MQTTNDMQKLLQAYREGQLVPDRAGVYWNKDERRRLRNLYLDGVGVSEIALIFQRTEQAVMQQLFTAGLLKSPNGERITKDKEPRCLCSNCKRRKNCKHCPQTKE